MIYGVPFNGSEIPKGIAAVFPSKLATAALGVPAVAGRNWPNVRYKIAVLQGVATTRAEADAMAKQAASGSPIVTVFVNERDAHGIVYYGVYVW